MVELVEVIDRFEADGWKLLSPRFRNEDAFPLLDLLDLLDLEEEPPPQTGRFFFRIGCVVERLRLEFAYGFLL